jgi:hypothetical protein
MSSLVEVQRIIGLSLNKIQMGRNQRGGLPLHKNLLVATVLNKARDAYMQETMYMNYRLMACGQFAAHQEELEEEDTPETEDYEEDSESDVEDDNTTSSAAATTSSADNNNSNKEYGMGPALLAMAGTLASCKPTGHLAVEEDTVVAAPSVHLSAPVKSNSVEASSNSAVVTTAAAVNNNNDEGFIDDSSDCDCDARNFCQDGGLENRVPFQYCFNCAPFHPSNGRGPTLVSPLLQHHHHHHHPSSSSSSPASVASSTATLPAATAAALLSAASSQVVTSDTEDKLIIYDMDSGLATRNSSQQQRLLKRKRHISVEETEEAVNSILNKRRRDVSGGECSEDREAECLDDSGFQEENEVNNFSIFPLLHLSWGGGGSRKYVILINICSLEKQNCRHSAVPIPKFKYYVKKMFEVICMLM